MALVGTENGHRPWDSCSGADRGGQCGFQSGQLLPHLESGQRKFWKSHAQQCELWNRHAGLGMLVQRHLALWLCETGRPPYRHLGSNRSILLFACLQTRFGADWVSFWRAHLWMVLLAGAVFLAALYFTLDPINDGELSELCASSDVTICYGQRKALSMGKWSEQGTS